VDYLVLEIVSFMLLWLMTYIHLLLN